MIDAQFHSPNAHGGCLADLPAAKQEAILVCLAREAVGFLPGVEREPWPVYIIN